MGTFHAQNLPEPSGTRSTVNFGSGIGAIPEVIACLLYVGCVVCLGLPTSLPRPLNILSYLEVYLFMRVWSKIKYPRTANVSCGNDMKAIRHYDIYALECNSFPLMIICT